ncbi:alginate lyase family protein [Promicromonospora sp. Populi]|uniref:alginate lyase family protein n=1 Tax=Promicromonospora sp. Populi TaxID=3239420 RepID=UPI0034E2D631
MQRSIPSGRTGSRVHAMAAAAATLALVATGLSWVPATADDTSDETSEVSEIGELLDLTRPDLADVAGRLAAGDESGAAAELRQHFAERTGVELPAPPANGLGDMTADELASGIFRFDGETRDFYNEAEDRIDIDWFDTWGGTESAPGGAQVLMSDFAFMPILTRAYLNESDPEARSRYATAWLEISLDFFADNPDWIQNRNLSAAKRLPHLVNTFGVFHTDPAITSGDVVTYLSGVHHTTDRLAQALQIHGGNNWYVSMARAIYTSAVYFPEFSASRGWEHFAVRSVEWFVYAYMKSDSIYREPAFNYQAYVADLINAMIRVGDVNGRTLPPAVVRAADWIADSMFATRMPNLQAPVVGDSPNANAGMAAIRTSGARNSWEDFAWVASDRTDGTTPTLGSTVYPISFAVQRSGWDPDARYMMINNQNTSYVASHRHPDDLSLVMAAYGRPLIVDPGASDYSDTETNEWLRRRTEAHNTIEVDGLSQEAGVTRATWLWRSNEGLDIYRGEAQGYQPISHDRVVYFVKPGFWIVSDALTGGTETHDYRQLWHFPGDPVTVDPDTQVATVGFDTVPGADDVAGVQLVPVGAEGTSLSPSVHEDGVAVVDNEVLTDVDYLSYDWTTEGATGLDTVVFPGPAGPAPSVTAARIDMPGVDHAVATALEVDLPSATGRFYLSREEEPSSRSFGAAATDAETAYLERDEDGALTRYSLTSGSSLVDDGESVIDASDVVSDISVELDGSTARVSLGDPFSGTLSLWAPEAEVVLVNGEPTELTRTGDVVSVALEPAFAPPPMLEEDFDEASLESTTYGPDQSSFDGWLPVEGAWDLDEDGTLAQTSTADGQAFAVQYDVPADVTITADVVPGAAGQATSRTGVAFRYHDARNYYRANVLNTRDGVQLQLVKVFNGEASVLAASALPINAGEAHTLTVSAVGKHLIATVGDTSISADDTRLPAGGAAAYTHGREAVFERLTVREALDQDHWRGVGGDVSVSSDQLRVVPTDGRARVLVSSAMPSRFSESCDYAVETTATINGIGQAGISLRDSTDSYGYRVHIGKTSQNTQYATIVREAHRSGPVTLATTSVRNRLDGPVELGAAIQGDRITVTLDGTAILEARDTVVRSGGVGLYATTASVFEDVRIAGSC